LIGTDRWYDPTKPRKAYDDPKGIHHGQKKNDKGEMVDVWSTVHHPAATPMPRGDAISLQGERDEEEARKA
jgi:hypothetical protein